MPRYIAFLRGVNPMNAKMPELRRCFESAGFTNVKTLLSSGNVVFDTRKSSEIALERKIQKALAKDLSRTFDTFVRAVDHLRELLDQDPYAEFNVPARAKRVITFLREAQKPKLPIAVDGATIFTVKGREVFTAYLASPRGPVFMTLIEKTFGKEQTTRTLDTIRKCVAA